MSGEIPSEPDSLLEYLSDQRLSDGLPVIPPTEARIDQMLTQSNRDSDEVILEVPTSFTPLSVEGLASCAVMAGCRPEYFPVVETAIDCLADWPNLKAMYNGTAGFSAAVIVNGPIRNEIEINSGQGLFGPGYRANATIGRAVNLVFAIVGEVFPGTGTMATHTHQGRYTYCFGENQEASPWTPFHADFANLNPDTNAVTVKPAHVPHPINEDSVGAYGESNPSPREVLEVIAEYASSCANAASVWHEGEVTFVISPDHAYQLDREFTKQDLKTYLYEHVRHEGARMMGSVDDAHIIVGGGAGNWTSIIHCHTISGNSAVTKPITMA